MDSALGIKDIPSDASHIEETLIELDAICFKNKIKYLVSGSTAFVCSIGNLLRIPNDVDVIYDIEKQSELQTALLERGYRRKIIKHHFLYTFIPLFEHYEKDGKILEVGAVKFPQNNPKRGIEFSFLLPLYSIPIRFRPILNLIFSKTMAMPNFYSFGKANFYGLSQEAQWIHTRMFMEEIKAFDVKKEKRFSDLIELSKHIDLEKIKEIIEEKPGIYYKKFPFPLATIHFSSLMDLTILLMKLERALGVKEKASHEIQFVKRFAQSSSY